MGHQPPGRDGKDVRSDQPEEDRRWPRHVFGVGTEPDPRFSLANERTFLAWMRTAVALIALAGGALTFDLPMQRWSQLAGAAILAATGVYLSVWAWWSWAKTERSLRRGRALPSLGRGAAAGVGLIAATAVFGLGVALNRS